MFKLKKNITYLLYREALLEAFIVRAWLDYPDKPTKINEEAEWFRESMSHICDAATAEQEGAELHDRYREAKKAFQRALVSAKTQANEMLLEALDREPLGRPYQVWYGARCIDGFPHCSGVSNHSFWMSPACPVRSPESVERRTERRACPARCKQLPSYVGRMDLPLPQIKGCLLPCSSLCKFP
ncbi:hypothetical protein KGM_212580 [Danaus plexippus plexippus]|uniref:Uncharacterized protein n=1 Tax=Danaus plexippus plexippus TaxID=278856 RepID=A0A212EID4_DANPL|nr:hypothetical protein KGM_212580 [Danaus plexippus plexippus]